ncbi:MAG: hypothetical protein KF699_02480 [Phycisphaeraceae bacterium]|nr:hypothetical protein [Phycisphaeraceae bacterium]
MRADQARKICTAAEYEVVRGATASEISQLSAAQVRAAVARARKLRDKFRTLAKKQRASARQRGEGRGGANNKNTKVKLALFEQTLERYEAALGRTGVSTRKAAKPKVKAKAKAKAAPVKAAPARSVSGKAAPARKAVASSLLGRVGVNGAASPILAAGRVDVTARVHARDLSRAAYSDNSKGQRLKNIYAGTANARIRGHARGAHRAAQAKRDAQQRGE